jgi:gas vesicle protein
MAMKKLLFGVGLGVAAVYFLDPNKGAERRERLTRMWQASKPTIIEAAQKTGSSVQEVSAEVSRVVGGKVTELRPKVGAGNGGSHAAEEIARA